MNELTRNSPLLRGQQKARQAGQLGREEACQFESSRGAPSACKFFILGVSEVAAELASPPAMRYAELFYIYIYIYILSKVVAVAHSLWHIAMDRC